MPRGARKKSDNGTYHIMLCGINKQQIFEEREDYEKFLEVLKSCKAKTRQGTVLCLEQKGEKDRGLFYVFYHSGMWSFHHIPLTPKIRRQLLCKISNIKQNYPAFLKSQSFYCVA